MGKLKEEGQEYIDKLTKGIEIKATREWTWGSSYQRVVQLANQLDKDTSREAEWLSVDIMETNAEEAEATDKDHSEKNKHQRKSGGSKIKGASKVL